ncbi:MAG: hypothetical protein M3552_08945 [Planctomycetota bacterium]|nr:hypothetical protein [Planctomycetaceae bacterium]MDQ3330767.1 hypothetical protein [Planctomycetota bacterium]
MASRATAKDHDATARATANAAKDRATVIGVMAHAMVSVGKVRAMVTLKAGGLAIVKTSSNA